MLLVVLRCFARRMPLLLSHNVKPNMRIKDVDKYLKRDETGHQKRLKAQKTERKKKVKRQAEINARPPSKFVMCLNPKYFKE
jgi:hypothetical protein